MPTGQNGAGHVAEYYGAVQSAVTRRQFPCLGTRRTGIPLGNDWLRVSHLPMRIPGIPKYHRHFGANGRRAVVVARLGRHIERRIEAAQ